MSESTTTEESTMNPETTTGMTGSLMAMMLMLQGMSSQRLDEILARQPIKDNQRESHLNTMAAIQSQYEVTLPEAFAAAKMAQSWGPGDNAAHNAAAITPNLQFQVKPA